MSSACPGVAQCVAAPVQTALKPSEMRPCQARICALPGAFLVSRLQIGPTQPCFRDEIVPLHPESCNLSSVAAANLPFASQREVSATEDGCSAGLSL